MRTNEGSTVLVPSTPGKTLARQMKQYNWVDRGPEKYSKEFNEIVDSLAALTPVRKNQAGGRPEVDANKPLAITDGTVADSDVGLARGQSHRDKFPGDVAASSTQGSGCRWA